MGSVPNTVRASGNFFEHAGGDRLPPTLEQKLLIVGRANTLGSNTEYWKPKQIITLEQAKESYGMDSELTRYLSFAITNYPFLKVYGVAYDDGGIENPVPQMEGETVKQPKKTSKSINYQFVKLFEEMADEFYTKLVIPFYDEKVLLELKDLAEKRNDPSVYRPISIYAPSNFPFEEQLSVPEKYNSHYINIIYLEDCPQEELGMLAVSASVAIASFDDTDLGRPYKTIPLRGISYRPPKNYVYNQVDALVRAGSSWIRVSNSDQLLLGDVCSTYRKDNDGFTDETWFFAETLANYQYKLFDLEYLIKSRYSQTIFVPSDSITRRDNVTKPTDVKLAIIGLIKGWEIQALSVNNEEIINTLKVNFNANNPARIDIQFTDQMSVGGRIFTVTYSHGFNKGAE